MAALRVAAGVIVRGELILVCQRRATDRHPLQWEFPGGKLEAGETYEQGLVRELREELDVEAHCGAELHRQRHVYPGNVEVEVAFLLARIVVGEPRNLTFNAMAWRKQGTLSELDFVEADREFVELLDRGGVL